MRYYSVVVCLSLLAETRKRRRELCRFLGARLPVLLLLIMPVSLSQAQWYCDPEQSSESAPAPECLERSYYSLHSDTALLGPCRVKVHVIRHSDGTVDPGVTLPNDSALQFICEEARGIFERDARIALEFDSIDFIDSDAIDSLFPTMDLNLYKNLALKHKTPMAIDVFLINNLSRSGSIFDLNAPYGACLVSLRQVYDQGGIGFHGRVMAHELGHVFGLLHTFDVYSGGGLEYVHRDRLINGDSACYHKGDHCCDTPAEPPGDIVFFDDVDCSLIESGLTSAADSDGVRYIDAPPGERPDSTNLMGYGRPMRCMTRFTPQQAMIMRCRYRSWPEQDLVRFVPTNRTENVANIGGKIVVYPPPEQIGLYAPVLFDSGDTILVLRDSVLVRLAAKDTMYYAGQLHRSLDWANNITKTELQRDWYYQPSQSEFYNSDNCAAWFEELLQSPGIAITIEGMAIDSLPVLFFDPWKPAIQSDHFLFDFPRSRVRYYIPPWTFSALRYKTPFSPQFGVFARKIPDTSYTYNNSYYRFAAPMAIAAETGQEFDPSGTQAPEPGDALFTRWFTDTTATAFYLEGIESPWKTTSLYFTKESQSITAEYKGHLLADRRFSTNSQRKLAHDGSIFWLLYESIDRHWLTWSRDPDGEGWAVEKELPGLPESTVACLDARNDLVVTTAAIGSQWRIVLVNAETTDERQTIDTDLTPGVLAQHAVIAKKSGAPTLVAIAEVDSAQSGTRLRLVVLHANNEEEDYQVQTTMLFGPVLGGSARTPSLACDETGAFHLAWEEDSTILYTRFLVDANGTIDSIDSQTPDNLSECILTMHGRNPSIAVDAHNRPHVAWEASLREIEATEKWVTFTSRKRGQVVAHRYKARPFSDPGSAASWSREVFFSIEGHEGLAPVVGADRFSGEKIGIGWWTAEDSGRVHMALAENDESDLGSWKRRTLRFAGSTPHPALRRNGPPLMVFTRDDDRYGAAHQQIHFTQDTNDVDFAVPSAPAPEEMRGAKVQNDLFAANVQYRMYEDSATGELADFIEVSDTTRIRSYTEIPWVVRTGTIETSHLLFDMRRSVDGISPGADPRLFDTVSVSWWAVVRNADNDTVVAGVKLGQLARDSLFTGVDSARVRFPRQRVYSEMVVETNIDVFPCIGWITEITIPRTGEEYSTQKVRIAADVARNREVSLSPAAPNPFSTRTRLDYVLPAPGTVRLTVHDALGRQVSVLVEGEQAAGRYSAVFDGGGLPNGLYICRLVSGGLVLTQQLYLVR